MADAQFTGYVYVVTNTVDGKQYVGQTSQGIRPRWAQHVSDTKRGRKLGLLHQAIAKYGPSAFTIHGMEVFASSRDEVDALEARLIAAFNSLAPDGYNLRYGGRRGRHGQVARQHMSEGQRNRAPISEETRAKQSAASRGRPSPFKGMTYAERGRVVTDETRAKLSAALKGRPSPRKGIPLTGEWRAAISAAVKGIPRPTLSASLRAAHARKPNWRGKAGS